MPEVGQAYVDVLPDTNRFGNALRSDMNRQRGALGNIGRTLGRGLAIGIGAGIAGVGILGKFAVDAAIEAEKVTAQTDAAIKSTRGVANVTAGEIQKLSERIMGYSGISDEAVASSANLLLTFTNIRNTVGEGNDIFDQSTKIVQDMSVALGQDAKSSAIQLGKALNDPILGLTSLSRVGVRFTEETKERITALVEQGKTLEAQKIILGELATEFGGSAKAIGQTFEGQMNIVKETLGNTLEDIGADLIPTLQKILPDIGKVLSGVLETIGPILGPVVESLSKALLPVIKALGPAVSVLGRVFAQLAQAMAPVITLIGRTLGKVLKALLPAVEPLVKALGGALLKALKAIAPELPSLARSITRIVIAITPLIPLMADSAAMFLELGSKSIAFLADKIADVLVPAIEGIVRIVRNVRDWWNRSWESIKRITGDVIAFLLKGFRNFLAVFINIAGGIVDAAAAAFGWVPGIGDKIIAFKDKFHRTTEGILEGLDRQIAKFDAWEGKSRGALQGATVDVKKLKDQIASFGAIGSLSVKTDFGALGDGLGIVAGPAGTPTSMFDALAAAVPGSQVISSGYRPGAITSSGNPSLHGIAPPWNAVDIAGANLLQVAQAAAAAYGPHLRELIFTPLGYSIKNGARTSPIAAADHYDHVHLADRGGWFRGPGMLAMGKGEEWFAGGLQKSGSAGPQKVVVEVRVKGPFKELMEVTAYEVNQSENRWSRARTRVG